MYRSLIPVRAPSSTWTPTTPVYQQVSNRETAPVLQLYVLTSSVLSTARVVACEQSLAHLYCGKASCFSQFTEHYCFFIFSSYSPLPLSLTDKGQVIFVYGADYGRRDETTCAYRRPSDQTKNTLCFGSTKIVAQRYENEEPTWEMLVSAHRYIATVKPEVLLNSQMQREEQVHNQSWKHIVWRPLFWHLQVPGGGLCM